MLAETAEPMTKIGEGDFDFTTPLGKHVFLLTVGVPRVALLPLPLDRDGALVGTLAGLGSSIGSAGSAGAFVSSVVVVFTEEVDARRGIHVY